MTTAPESRGWPELQEELARKAIETVQRFDHLHSAGTISDETFYHVADAIYDCITGLAPWDVANIIYAVRQEMRNERPQRHAAVR